MMINVQMMQSSAKLHHFLSKWEEEKGGPIIHNITLPANFDQPGKLGILLSSKGRLLMKISYNMRVLDYREQGSEQKSYRTELDKHDSDYIIHIDC